MKRLKILTRRLDTVLYNDLSGLYVKSLSRKNLKQSNAHCFPIDFMQSFEPYMDTGKVFLNTRFSLNTKLINFRHRLRNTFRFILNTAVFNKCTSFILNFNKTLRCVFSLKNSYLLDSAYFLILRPGRGGYTCLYNGVVGFIFTHNILPFIHILKKKSFLYSSNVFNVFRFTVTEPYATVYPFYMKQKLLRRYAGNIGLSSVNQFILVFSIRKLNGYINVNKKIVTSGVSNLYRRKKNKVKKQSSSSTAKFRSKTFNKKIL